jgi:hypothetical protein
VGLSVVISVADPDSDPDQLDRMFLGLPDSESLVQGTDPDPSIKQKY